MDRRKLPLLPLRGVLVYPNMVLHLDVGREKSVKALEQAMVTENQILLVTQKDPREDSPRPEDLYQLGTVVEIKQMLKLPGGTIRVLVEGLHRARVLDLSISDPYYEAIIENVEVEEEKTLEIEALMRSALYRFERYVKASKRVPHEALSSLENIDKPGRLADAIAAHLPLKIEDKQGLLEAVSPRDRLKELCDIISKEVEILQLEQKINVRVKKQMEKTQREYYLREQLKAIQQELGEHGDGHSEAEELRERLEEAQMPDEVREKAEKEIARLEKMPPAAAEAVVVRTYVEWLLNLPWEEETPDQLDIDKAAEVLDEDHYGLKKVKDRILEYLAVRQLSGKMKGPILCLIGPPGVGKTSLAKSIARATGRKFVRISLGGVRDEAEIRGHRRTYVGALPGRIIQGMRTAGSKNPVFLMDEIDKMSTDFRGDPSAALLEVLDPEQNSAFSDHYIELPFDLSKVFFVTTANTAHTIPQPLLDRMEVIRLSGYTEEEKVKIAELFLVPKQLKEHGLKARALEISENALRMIIRRYTREAGVRNLEREIAGICRKVAREVVRDSSTRIKVTVSNLHKYLGAPRYQYGRAEMNDEVGAATGMAVTQAGGDLLTVEVTLMPGKGSLTLTGQLGDVMKESAEAAMSYVRTNAARLGIAEDFYQQYDFHIHVPAGAIPKDGPSAGITIATALASALTKRAVSKDVSMTGEITLRGRVLPVGGVKEKVLAAHRAGIKQVILPKENEKDLEDIPQPVRRKLKFILANHMDEVLPAALPGGTGKSVS